jgi:predicted nucleic acid-binding protein
MCRPIACSFDSDEENDWFVKLAAEVDDGEAACLAIAKCRGWAIATDDRPASRLAGELNIAVVCTAELIKKWADQTSVAVGEIEAAVRNVQMFAKFVPRKGSPEYDWWLRHLRAV